MGKKAREQEEANAKMMGRVSYEAFSTVWPTMTDDFARYDALPKFVVLTTLEESDLVSDWGNQQVIRSLDGVSALKEAYDGTIIVHGSATLNRNLADADLIDRYHLLVFPVLLGAAQMK